MFNEIKTQVADNGLSALFEIESLKSWSVEYVRDSGRLTAVIESPNGRRFQVWSDGSIERI